MYIKVKIGRTDCSEPKWQLVHKELVKQGLDEINSEETTIIMFCRETSLIIIPERCMGELQNVTIWDPEKGWMPLSSCFGPLEWIIINHSSSQVLVRIENKEQTEMWFAAWQGGVAIEALSLPMGTATTVAI